MPDFELLKVALKEAKFDLPIIRYKNGEEAVLQLTGNVNPQQYPAFILMDINMPLMDGKQTLTILKADPATAKIPVAMLTVSSDPRDVEECYKLGANTFVNKSANYEDFAKKIGYLKEFWFDVAELPTLEDDVEVIALEIMPKAG